MGMLEDAIRAYAKFEDRESDPSTPSSGHALVYVKDGAIHSINDQGEVTAYGAGNGNGGSGGAWEHIDSVEMDEDGNTVEIDGLNGEFLWLHGLVWYRNAADDVLQALRVNDDDGENYLTLRWEDGTSHHERSEFSFFRYWDHEGDIGMVSFWISKPHDDQRAALVAHASRHGTTDDVVQFLGAGQWRNTSDPINKLTLLDAGSGEFAAGTTFTLLGLRRPS